MQLPESVEVLPSQGGGEEFSIESASWKSKLEPMTGNVIMSQVDALMYVVLSKA